MDALVAVGQNPLYIRKIKSDRLLQLSRRCPDDGTFMTATGYMYQHKLTLDWAAEYYCPDCHETIVSWTRDSDAQLRQIAQAVLGDEYERAPGEGASNNAPIPRPGYMSARARRIVFLVLLIIILLIALALASPILFGP